MESRKESNLELIYIDSILHTRYIFSVHAYLLHETITTIEEEDAKSGFPIEDEQSDLDAMQRSVGAIIVRLIVFKDVEDETLKFDNDSQSKPKVKIGVIDNCVNKLTGDIQK